MSDLPPAYEFTKELGAYTELPPDVKTELLMLLEVDYDLSPSAQAEAYDAMTKHVEKPEFQKTLLDETKALRDSALKVDEAFERVRQGLGKVDANDYKDKDGNPIQKFQPTWDGYQKRWTALLWGSRSVATKTEAYINDFLEVVVRGVEDIKTEDNLKDARLDLDEFIKREDPNQLNPQETVDSAQNYSQGFTDLKRDLETFKGTFDKIFAEDHKVDLDEAITTKQAEIKILDQEIDKCLTVIIPMGIALGVTVCGTVAGAVGALASLGPIGPYVAIGVVIVGVMAVVKESKGLTAYLAETNLKEKWQNRSIARTQLAGLQAQLKDLKALQAILDNQKTDIPEICGRLDRFSHIWGLVRHDAEVIQTHLSIAVGDKGSKRGLQRRMDLMKASYTALRDALNLYATTINKYNLKK